MFTKTKLDSKTRFQQPGFRKQLQDARQYKREAKKPEQDGALAKIGLSSTRAKILVPLALAVLFYLTYAPNFLFIKHISVSGLTSTQSQQAEESAKNYMALKPLLAQRNLVFLSAKNLEKYILSNNQNILDIKNVKKIFPDSIAIAATPRVSKFFLQTPQNQFIVSSDGLMQEQVTQATSSDPALITLKVQNASTIPQQLPKQLTNDLNSIAAELARDGRTEVAEFGLRSLNEPEVTVVTKAGFNIKLDFKENLQQTYQQLELMLSQVDQTQNIAYIDLRLQNRGFLCLKKAACAQEQSPTQQATSTPIINP